MNEKFKDTDLREALRRNYANVPEMRTPLQLPRGGEAKTRPMRRWLYPIPAIAASILIAFLLWPKGETVPIAQPETQQPVVAEVHEPHKSYEPRESYESRESYEPRESYESRESRQPQQPAAEAQNTLIATREGQGESPLVESLPLLAEAQNTPIPEELGESPVELPVLPPDRQALVDMFLAEEALQVAYMQQEQTEELRAFTAGLEGKEPETSHLIIAF